jgi:hypothetical protein
MIEHTGAVVLTRQLIILGVVKLPPATPWPAYVNFLAETPDQAIAVLDQPGVSGGREMRGGLVLEKPGIQITIRAKTNPAGTNFGLKLCEWLKTIANVQVVVPAGDGLPQKTYLIDVFQRTSPVYPLGQEEGGSRLLYTINGLITYGELP